MTINKVGLDLNALQNISAPQINITQSATEILTQLPQTAQDITGGWFAYLILGGIFVITYWYLSDKADLGEFKYSDIRALVLSLGIVASIGLTQIAIGFIQSWVAVAFALLSFTLASVILLIIENRQ